MAVRLGGLACINAGFYRPALLAGTSVPREARLTYFGVLQTSMSDLAKVIECLRSA
jgi:hypothetical protein